MVTAVNRFLTYSSVAVIQVMGNMRRSPSSVPTDELGSASSRAAVSGIQLKGLLHALDDALLLAKDYG
eukprot:9258006-Prorocentrum_lima.AAC.1